MSSISIDIKYKKSLAYHFEFKDSQQQIWGLTGPSGSGKTTFLKLVAGLLSPDDGFVEVNGNPWFNKAADFSLSTDKRSIGYLDQHNFLFSHLSVKITCCLPTKDVKTAHSSPQKRSSLPLILNPY